jgi:hypothetical protein
MEGFSVEIKKKDVNFFANVSTGMKLVLTELVLVYDPEKRTR